MLECKLKVASLKAEQTSIIKCPVSRISLNGKNNLKLAKNELETVEESFLK